VNRFLAGLVLGFSIPSFVQSQASAVLEPEVRKTAEALRERAFAGSQAARWVQDLTDHVGPRLTGSPGDAAAVSWAVEKLRALGFTHVHAEKVVSHVWRRGVETGEVTSPVAQRLLLTALGGSVPTPPEGIEAEVVELPSLEALAAQSAAVQGKIVFFNKRMVRTENGSGYSTAVDVRSRGPARAAKLGAVAVLIRSVGTDHNRTPHTGGTEYEEGVHKIPAAALSIPDAELLERLLLEKKPVRVRLTLTCHDDADAETANVIGEVAGRDKPQEVVLLGAHLDSWDLATGAIDDGAGCGIVIEAARLVSELPRHPRRTVRVVLYANEEHGLAGGRAYRQTHDAELMRHAAALEADSGTDGPTAFSWNAGPSAEPLVREIAEVLAPAGAGRLLSHSSGGADIGPLRQEGVPVFSIQQDSSRYFDYHHTANDTFDKIVPASLDRVVAAVAAFAYIAAETPQPFERIPPESRKEAE
jgi:carboxypeptidase Q